MSSLFCTYFLLSDSFAEESDLEEKLSVLSEDPCFSYDEFGNANRMKFCVEGETVPYWIPMSLMGKWESEVLQLQSGDKIRVLLKKKQSFNLMDHFYARTGRRVYGFGKINKPLYYTATEALAHFNGFLMRFFALLCGISGIVFAYWGFKYFG